MLDIEHDALQDAARRLRTTGAAVEFLVTDVTSAEDLCAAAVFHRRAIRWGGHPRQQRRRQRQGKGMGVVACRLAVGHRCLHVGHDQRHLGVRARHGRARPTGPCDQHRLDDVARRQRQRRAVPGVEAGDCSDQRIVAVRSGGGGATRRRHTPLPGIHVDEYPLGRPQSPATVRHDRPAGVTVSTAGVTTIGFAVDRL